MTAKIETIEVLSDEDNCNVRRVQRLTHRLKLLRDGYITADHYRLFGAIAEDLAVRTGASGGRWQRLPGDRGYVAMPRGSAPPRAPQERVPEASFRLGAAKDAVGADVAWALLEFYLTEDPTIRNFEGRARIEHGTGLRLLLWMVDRIDAAEVYESAKWRTVIHAEAAAP